MPEILKIVIIIAFCVLCLALAIWDHITDCEKTAYMDHIEKKKKNV